MIGGVAGRVTLGGGCPGGEPSRKPADMASCSWSRRGRNRPKPPPRREVRGEGRWLPAVVTGADGKAVATVPMPETTTAWRLTARGCTVETLVGQATAPTLTRKDFFVELKTPSFLREGDEIRVVGRVHNLTDFAGPVTLKLRVLDAQGQNQGPRRAREDRRGEGEVRRGGRLRRRDRAGLAGNHHRTDRHRRRAPRRPDASTSR